MIREFDIREGMRITLEKHIPVAAGMAGGSSNAAAVLFGMNRMFSLGLSEEELKKRGVILGADVLLYYAGTCSGGRDRRDPDAASGYAEMLCADCKAAAFCVYENRI